MLANKFTGVRIIYALTAMLILLITLVSCLGKSNETFPMMKLPVEEAFYGARITDMIIQPTVKQGESPEISLKVRMTEEMKSLFTEQGYAWLSLSTTDGNTPPGRDLQLSVAVLYIRNSAQPYSEEIEAIFPSSFKPHPLSEDPFGKKLTPGRYNVYAYDPGGLPDNPIKLFGSFEVLPND